MFSLLLATRILRHHGKLPAAEYDFLMTGGANVSTQGVSQHVANPDPTWVTDAMWEQVRDRDALRYTHTHHRKT